MGNPSNYCPKCVVWAKQKGKQKQSITQRRTHKQNKQGHEAEATNSCPRKPPMFVLSLSTTQQNKQHKQHIQQNTQTTTNNNKTQLQNKQHNSHVVVVALLIN